jgi:bacterioferritin-associated ferredoxin
MILCLCKGVSDRKVREMVREGQSLRQIVKSCEASTCCGACAPELKGIVKDEKKSIKPDVQTV